ENVGGIEGYNLFERGGGCLLPARFFRIFGEPEPAGGPAGHLFERLFHDFGGLCELARFREHAGVVGAAVGNEIAGRKVRARHGGSKMGNWRSYMAGATKGKRILVEPPCLRRDRQGPI